MSETSDVEETSYIESIDNTIDNEAFNTTEEVVAPPDTVETAISSEKDDAESEFGDFDNGSEFGDFDNESEFGDFDNENNFDNIDNNSDFGDLEETQVGSANNVENIKIPDITMTLDGILQLWSEFTKATYIIQPIDNFTDFSSTKSIKLYVLKDAPELLHSRITWDSVTKYMDDDTGIPKVRWSNSEIEKSHLKALGCQRSVTPISAAPTMLNTSKLVEEPSPLNSPLESIKATSPNVEKSPTSLAIESNSAKNSASISMEVNSMKSPTSPTSEKRSSIFGLSSLSRYLPHLSKSKLPSPTSPKSPTHSFSTSRVVVPNHNIVTSPPMQHMMTQKPPKHTEVNRVKRANTVSYPSTRTTPRARPISTQSMGLLDLIDEDITSTSRTSPLNFTPLVPTASVSTPQQARRFTIPANLHSDVKPSIAEPTADNDDDDFGDFTGEETDIGSNTSAFDTFNTIVKSSVSKDSNDYLSKSTTIKSDLFDQSTSIQKTAPLILSPTSVYTNNDSYGQTSYFQKPASPNVQSLGTSSTQGDPYDRESYFQKAVPSKASPSPAYTSNDPFDRTSYFQKYTPPSSQNTTQSGSGVNDDPYNRASYFVHKQNNDIPPQKPALEDDPFDVFLNSKPQSTKPVNVSSTAQFDLLSPVYNHQQINTKKTTSAKQELFDSFMEPTTQKPNDTKPAVDDEDWGDWAF